MTVNVKGRNLGGIARFLPPRKFLVAIFLLSIFLIFSATAAHGHTKRDASLAELSEAGLKPDVNRQQDVVVDEDFESGVGPDIALSNGVKIVCMEGNCFVKQVATALQDAEPYFNVGSRPWRDYSFRFRFNVRSNNGGPYVRWHTSVDGGYGISPIGQFGFRLKAQRSLGRNIIDEHRFDDIRSPYPARQWNTLEVQAVGNRILVFLNGSVVADEIVPEDYRLLGGNLSVSTPAAAGGDVEIWYDDLEVRLLSLPEPTPTPRPANVQAGEIVIDEDFETGFVSGLRLFGGAIVACEEGNCFNKHVATSRPVSGPITESSASFPWDHTLKFRFNVRSEKGGPTVKWRRTQSGQYEIRPIGQKGFRLAARKSAGGKFVAAHRFDDIRSPYAVREWNTLEIRTNGDRISVLLNGDLVAVEFVPVDFQSATGPVAIFTEAVTVGSTSHDVEVWYDDIEVRLLGLTETPGSVINTPAPATDSGTRITRPTLTGASATSPTPAPASATRPVSSNPTVAESSGDSEMPEEKTQRGFFTNTRPGESAIRANSLIDPTILAVIGIMLTMLATMVQLFKGQ